jgi:hypothetical protein
MTRNQPLTRVNLKEPLLLGASRIPLHWGDSPYTMSVFQGKPVTLPASPYIVADRSFFYIEDFREVPAFVEWRAATAWSMTNQETFSSPSRFVSFVE